MRTIPKIVGVSSCTLVLCIGLSYAYAAHPQAAPDQSDDRGSQGNQDLIKGDSTPRKGDEKVDETKVKGAVLHALIRSVQWLSAHRGYTPIGSNVIAVCIPKAFVEESDGISTYTIVPGNPQDNQPTFLYVNAEGFASAKFSPILVGRRSTVPHDPIIVTQPFKPHL